MKQRHTAKRIFQRLRDEHGFVGGYPTAVGVAWPTIRCLLRSRRCTVENRSESHGFSGCARE